MKAIQALSAIIKKDIIIEIKSKEIINSILLFALLTVIIFSFIFEPGTYKKEVIGGIFWMSIIFSGILGLGKSMSSEVNGGNLTAVMLTPVDRSVIFFGKFISNLIFLIFLEIILVPLFMIFYDVNILAAPLMILVIFLATYGYCLLGTFFAILSVKTKTREILLPILLLPVMIPVILAAILATNAFLLNEPVINASGWIKLIAGFDIVFTAVIYLIFGSIIED